MRTSTASRQCTGWGTAGSWSRTRVTLKRQLLIVSLMVLVLPWAGCQFIRETESALRAGQQDMLAGTARAIADTLSQYPEDFPEPRASDFRIGDQLYGHELTSAPRIDGYFEDWPVGDEAAVLLTGSDGEVRVILGVHGSYIYLFAAVSDRDAVFLPPGALPGSGRPHVDRVELRSVSPPYLDESFIFAAEAPGRIVTYVRSPNGTVAEPSVHAHWQDVPGGYQVEARIPRRLLGVNLGVEVTNTDNVNTRGATVRSFASQYPGTFVRSSSDLARVGRNLVQPGMRLVITDYAGWRLAEVGTLELPGATSATPVSNWLRLVYVAIVERGTDARFATPAATGREQQLYIRDALNGRPTASWFRSGQSGNAVVAVAQPITDGTANGGAVVGSVVLQQGTDAILSLTNEGLSRLLNVTLIATLAVAAGLLGYATWLSRRIRKLSVATEAALSGDGIDVELPSANASDELGDLSRSFSNVLGALGEYNAYLRTLASKLSHELRTPLAIVTSSLDNLEHEALDESARNYTERAKDGAERLRRILNAMSEANRVEELMQNAELRTFDLEPVLASAVSAYRDVYAERQFEFQPVTGAAIVGSPELLIQMLDKLVDNAVSFSAEDDTIVIALDRTDDDLCLSVANPGPPLPDKLRGQLFDSLVSLRSGGNSRHLGLGLFIARLIAEGHGGAISGDNTDDGVRFSVSLPGA